MPVQKCKFCKKEFSIKQSRVDKGWGKYCSSKCQYQGYQTGKFVNCDICGNKIYRAVHEIKHSESKQFFCNKSCFAVWKNQHLLIGKKHPRWKDGRASYRETMLRTKILPVCEKCGIKDLRVLLTHHIDSDRKNNKISNSKWLCRNCHYLVHDRRTI